MAAYDRHRAALRQIHKERCCRGRLHRSLRVLILLGIFLLAPLAHQAHAQPSSSDVVVVRVTDTVDLGLAPYLARALREAQDRGARAVIVEINTPGGRLDAALQIRDALLGAPVRTIAFVNREALSAGALIALAAHEIYLAPGAVLGAATPVDGAGNTADAKTISAVRSIFRATAEERGRDPLLAEAMVDPAVAAVGAPAGTLLTLTAEEALRTGYAEAIVADQQALLGQAGLAGATVRDEPPSLAERLVRLLTMPIIASLLVALGLLLLLADLLTAGFGVVGSIGIGLLALFFWGHMLAGLAGWEGVVLVALGLLLVAAEVVIIPGFGVPGVLGIAALVGGLYISLVGGRVVTGDDVTRAAATLALSAALLVAGGVVLVRWLPRAGRLQGLILQAQVGIPGAAPARRRRALMGGARLEAMTAPSDAARPSLIGATGVASSSLRPGGIAEIDGVRVDVVSEGAYIPAGTPIEVIADEGYRRVVRQLRASDRRRDEGD